MAGKWWAAWLPSFADEHLRDRDGWHPKEPNSAPAPTPSTNTNDGRVDRLEQRVKALEAKEGE